ncbi:hypothetical protein [Actinomadura madurae]|nr:hypothetical protein [Actinomadura madurae]
MATAGAPSQGGSDGKLHLPKRRRGATLSGTVQEQAAPAPRPRDPGARFAAFRESASGRHRTTGGSGEHDTTSTQEHDQ